MVVNKKTKNSSKPKIRQDRFYEDDLAIAFEVVSKEPKELSKDKKSDSNLEEE